MRDASAYVMAVYEKTSTTDLTQTEVHLYGSSRLGIYTAARNVQNPLSNSSGISIFERGHKFFELSNHLGNVLVTVSDRKIGVDNDNNAVIDYYTADLVTATDYYPFGWIFRRESLEQKAVMDLMDRKNLMI